MMNCWKRMQENSLGVRSAWPFTTRTSRKRKNSKRKTVGVESMSRFTPCEVFLAVCQRKHRKAAGFCKEDFQNLGSADEAGDLIGDERRRPPTRSYASDFYSSPHGATIQFNTLAV